MEEVVKDVVDHAKEAGEKGTEGWGWVGGRGKKRKERRKEREKEGEKVGRREGQK